MSVCRYTAPIGRAWRKREDGTGAMLETGLRKFGAIIGDRTEIGCNSVLNPGSILGREWKRLMFGTDHYEAAEPTARSSSSIVFLSDASSLLPASLWTIPPMLSQLMASLAAAYARTWPTSCDGDEARTVSGEETPGIRASPRESRRWDRTARRENQEAAWDEACASAPRASQPANRHLRQFWMEDSSGFFSRRHRAYLRARASLEKRHQHAAASLYILCDRETEMEGRKIELRKKAMD